MRGDSRLEEREFFGRWVLADLFSILFSAALYLNGLSALTSLLIGAFLLILNFFFLRAVRTEDKPLVLGGIYLSGVILGFVFWQTPKIPPALVAGVFTLLFILGILGNYLYFLSEKKKLEFLNGEITDAELGKFQFGDWFPLWLMLVGNLVLIVLVTPFWWSSLYNFLGAKLFVSEHPLQLKHWFIYLLQNLNESFIGIAALMGLDLPVVAVEPTGLGKALIFAFRIGIISLGLGALKRYIDLLATTRRLVKATALASFEVERWEFHREGQRQRVEPELRELESRRQLWLFRLRQLLRLYPAQIWRLLNFLAGRKFHPLFDIKDKRLFLDKDSKYSVNSSEFARSELIKLFGDNNLYAQNPSLRPLVLRELLTLPEVRELSARERTQLVRSLVALNFKGDPPNIVRKIDSILHSFLKLSDRKLSSPRFVGWSRTVEGRSKIAALETLVKFGKKEYLTEFIPPLQMRGTLLYIEAFNSLLSLRRFWPKEQFALLKASLNLLEARDKSFVKNYLDEILKLFSQLPARERTLFCVFVPKTVVIFWKNTPADWRTDGELLEKIADILRESGEKNAARAAWEVVQLLPDSASRQKFISLLIERGLSDVTASFFRHILRTGSDSERISAARLLSYFPSSEKNRRALWDVAKSAKFSPPVRWQALASMAELATGDDLDRLKTLQFHPKNSPKLWSILQIALGENGDIRATERYLSVLESGGEKPIVVRRIFEEEIPASAELISSEGEESSDAEEYLSSMDSEHAVSALYREVVEALSQVYPEECQYISRALNRGLSAEERGDAVEELIAKKPPVLLPILSWLLLSPKSPRSLRQKVAEDLGLLGRSLHISNLGVFGRRYTPARLVSRPLLRALDSDSDKLVKIRAARALGRLGLPEITEELFRQLRDSSASANVRQTIAQAFGELGIEEFRPKLKKLFADEKSVQVKQGLVKALDLLGEKEVFFLSLFDSKNAALRQLALAALMRRPLSKESEKLFLKGLTDRHRDVRATAIAAIGKFGLIEATDTLLKFLDPVEEANGKLRREAVRALSSLVRTLRKKRGGAEVEEQIYSEFSRSLKRDGDHLVIQEIANSLALLWPDKAGPELFTILKSRRKKEVWRKSFAGLVRALGSCGYSKAGDYLHSLLERELKSEYPNIHRINALLRPVAQFSKEKALPLLLSLAERNEPSYSWNAVLQLSHWATPPYIEKLEQLFTELSSKGELEPHLHAALLVSLVKLGRWNYLSQLFSLLSNPENTPKELYRQLLNVLSELQLDLSSLFLIRSLNPEHEPLEKVRKTALSSLSKLYSRNIKLLLQALHWQKNSDPRAPNRLEAERNIEYLLRELEKVHSYASQPASDFTTLLGWNDKPLHPAWSEPWKRSSEEGEASDEAPPKAEEMKAVAAEKRPAPAIAPPPLPKEKISERPESKESALSPSTSQSIETSVTSEDSVALRATPELGRGYRRLGGTGDKSVAPVEVERAERPEPPEETAPGKVSDISEPKISSKEFHRWLNLLADGSWGRAIEEAKFKAYVSEEFLQQLEELYNWCTQNRDMVYLSEGPGNSEDTITLMRSHYVSRREYYQFCRETGAALPPTWLSESKYPKNYPVLGLSYYDAERFAQAMGASIPSLEELEFTVKFKLFDTSLSEWTRDHYRTPARLFIALSGNGDKPREKFSILRDEAAQGIAFRIVKKLNTAELPLLLREHLYYLPPAIPVENIPLLLGVSLQYRLKSSS